jgi:hypothetical protein
MNMAPSAVTVERVETLDAESGAVLGTLDGEALKQMLRLNGGGNASAGRRRLPVHGRHSRQGRRDPESA